MKKTKVLLLSLVALGLTLSLQSKADALGLSITSLAEKLAVTSPIPADLINWKVGDKMEYNVKMAFGGGSMVKSVTKDEGAALWMKQVLNLMGRQEVIEILLNKADGKVLKILRNGQEQAIPDDQPEIISTNYTTVTVPAGTFRVLHVVGKSKQVSKFEMWVNPQDTVMDGTVKQVISSLVEITMELVRFTRGGN